MANMNEIRKQTLTAIREMVAPEWREAWDAQNGIQRGGWFNLFADDGMDIADVAARFRGKCEARVADGLPAVEKNGW